MKTFFTTLILTVVFLASTLSAQTNWTKKGMVLNVGSEGAWDDYYVAFSSIIYDSTTSTFKMWYTGGQGISDGKIGYATSIDGEDWTKYENNPILETGPADAWDDSHVGFPSVVVVGNTYHMWYAGGPDQTTLEIGYATSSDGIVWTKYENNPVIEVGAVDSWEETWVYLPSVNIIGSTFHMWYAGAKGDPIDYVPWVEQVGYATSLDGINWTKYANNPVLDLGTANTWDSKWATAPCVSYHGNTYHMWFSGWPTSSELFRIGYATSADGITWEKYASNPILAPESWEQPRVQNPNVILIGNTYHMWYSGGGFFTWRIGYATAPDSNSTGIYDDFSSKSPGKFMLMQNHPNPFNPTTAIEFTLPKTEFVELKIFNIIGKEVAIMVSNKLNQGNHTYQFEGKNLASGVYYYRIEAGEFQDVKKMILLR
jgi:predicted GH43/DUF377 family glycosyl hydrolase